MNYLSAENISKSYGDQVLFEGLTFGLGRGDKTALIARNGAGKTTLLRILGGLESTDSGEYTFRNGIKVGFLDQSPVLDANVSVKDLISTANTSVLDAIKRYETAMKAHEAKNSPGTEGELQLATNEMDRLQGWDYENRLIQLLDLFRITDTSQRVGSLSGGEKKRLALALVLLDEPEFLILDEPTNHLDIDMIEWLEAYLSKANLTVFMVTHDRYFLDRVCNHILELDQNRLYRYQGNYDYFLEKRAERYGQQQTEADRAAQLMKKELEWLRRMPKARTHKSKSRIDAFDDIREKATLDAGPGELNLQVDTPRIGGKVLELKKLSKSYENAQIIKEFSYKFGKSDRIGVIGRNGTGKTTFLNLLAGTEQPDSGKRIPGETIKMGYYRQMGVDWKEDARVIDAVKEIAEVVRLKDGKTVSASKFLEHFMFPPKDQYKRIEKLSGGEKRRLHLLTVLIRNPNFLLLDEPTNDLDLFALNKLEEFLISFEGNLVIVSHDRYLLDKLTDHIFIFDGKGEIQDYYGTYSSYRTQREPSASGKTTADKKPGIAGQKDGTAQPGKANARKGKAPSRTRDSGKASPKPVKKGLSYKEKIEYEKLEPEIELLETEKAALEQEIASGQLGFEDLNSKSVRVAELLQLIDEKTLRWIELGEWM